MPTYVLDLYVKDAETDSEISNVKTPLWFILHADGYPQPIATTQAIPCKNPKWNFPVRLILTLNDISAAYLYITLATFKIGSESSLALARSRIGLRALPIGSPKQFQFPLMSTANATKIAAKVTFLATLSELSHQKDRVSSDGVLMHPRRPGPMYYGSN